MEVTYFYLLMSILLTFGGSYIISNSTALEPFRAWLGKFYYKNKILKWAWILITCQVCTSFWVAGGIGLLYPAYSLTSIFMLDGIIGCATTNFMIAIHKKILHIPKTSCCGCANKNKEDID
jgi:hypothetical protein